MVSLFFKDRRCHLRDMSVVKFDVRAGLAFAAARPISHVVALRHSAPEMHDERNQNHLLRHVVRCGEEATERRQVELEHSRDEPSVLVEPRR